MSCFVWSELQALPDERDSHPSKNNPQHKCAKEEGRPDPGTSNANGEPDYDEDDAHCHRICPNEISPQWARTICRIVALLSNSDRQTRSVYLVRPILNENCFSLH
jgi:hypothetical protein